MFVPGSRKKLFNSLGKAALFIIYPFSYLLSTFIYAKLTLLEKYRYDNYITGDKSVFAVI